MEVDQHLVKASSSPRTALSKHDDTPDSPGTQIKFAIIPESVSILIFIFFVPEWLTDAAPHVPRACIWTDSRERRLHALLGAAGLCR